MRGQNQDFMPALNKAAGEVRTGIARPAADGRIFAVDKQNLHIMRRAF
jgi:hypothetical protein